MQDYILVRTECAIYHLILRKTRLLIDLFHAEEIKFRTLISKNINLEIHACEILLFCVILFNLSFHYISFVMYTPETFISLLKKMTRDVLHIF